MRKHRTRYMEGLFYNTGNYHESRMGDAFGFTRQYADTVSQQLLDDERINNLHKKEEQDKIDEKEAQQNSKEKK